MIQADKAYYKKGRVIKNSCCGYRDALAYPYSLPLANDKKDDVLFYLPVTKSWLKQLILTLILICHSFYRGVKELLRDLFDYKLRFFLNHRTFMRSEHPERVGFSPTELLTGEKHPHWLELLGFKRFQRSEIAA